MGIVSFPLSPVRSALLAPMQALAAWLAPVRRVRAPVAVRSFAKPASAPHLPHQLALPFGAAGKASRCRPVPAPGCSSKPAVSRLRVVRVFDQAVAPSCAGRMVISGRMADVCAELERMSEFEGQQAWHLPR